MNASTLKLNLTKIILINLPDGKSKGYGLNSTFKEKKSQKMKLLRFARFITKPPIRRNLKGAKRRIIRRN